MIVKHVKNEKGSIMIETVCGCMLLLMFFIAFIEFFFMLQGSIYTQRIAREAAREATITRDIETAKQKARDMSQQYFGNTQAVTITFNDPNSTNNTVVECITTHQYKPLHTFRKEGVGSGVTLHGQAIFPWWDQM